jgi:hypothetical protein
MTPLLTSSLFVVIDVGDLHTERDAIDQVFVGHVLVQDPQLLERTTDTNDVGLHERRTPRCASRCVFSSLQS